MNSTRQRLPSKKVQAWNHVQVTFDIPKDVVHRLRLFSIDGHLNLIELGILNIDIPTQADELHVNQPTNPTNTTIRMYIDIDICLSLSIVIH
jgi:hypothetical protein